MSTSKPFKRCLLKLSGEVFSDRKSFGIDPKKLEAIATSLYRLSLDGIELAVVIGGGNFFRGASLEEMGLKRTSGDAMGMLATLINGIALKEAIEKAGGTAAVMSALSCPDVVPSFEEETAKDLLSQKKILILTGGTGNPFFTTDTAAALKACELKADILLKGTKVDGVYDKDPIKSKLAIKYSSLTYGEVLSKQYGVMDLAAVSLCMQNFIPIFVFNMDLLHKPSKLWLANKDFGTLVN